MLQAIRDHLTGWVAVILFIVIGLAFALWGVPNRNTATASPAEVNGKQIPLEEIRRAVRNQLAQFQQYSEISPDYEKLIRNQVLQGLVTDEVLSQYTEKAGYHIGNEALVSFIRNMQGFQDQGQFSLDLYKSRLATQGLSVQYFEAQVSRSLRISQLRQGIMQTAFVTKAELEQRARLERQQRKAEWIQIKNDANADPAEISPEAVREYYSANSDQYMRPESVDIAYVELRLDSLVDEAAVTDAELSDYYEAEVGAGRFQEPEERQARHILISVDAETDDAAASQRAQALLERLKNGEDFATLATEYSDDPGSAPEGGDLGWAQRSAYVGPFADVLFSMKTGELSGLVRTQFGYHIITMDGLRGGMPKPLQEVSEELRLELARRQAEGRYYDLADQMRDLSFENSGTLEPMADALGLTIERLTGVTRSGGQGIAAEQALIDAAFSQSVMDERQNSDPIDLSPDRRVVVRVENHSPAEVRPLEEVSESIVATLQAEAVRQRALDAGQAVLKRLQAGGALAELAVEYNAEHHAEDSYRRTSGLPPALREALFKAPKPASGARTIEGVALADGSYAVFALTDVIPGDVANPGAPDAVANQQGVGDLSAYIADLKDAASVQLRPDLLE